LAAPAACGEQARVHLGVIGIKTQADDMHGFMGKGDGDLRAREVGHAMSVGGSSGALLATNFIVIGQSPQFNAVARGAFSQSLGFEGAVGDDGMAMQVSVKYGHAPILGWCKAIVRAQGLFLWSVALP